MFEARAPKCDIQRVVGDPTQRRVQRRKEELAGSRKRPQILADTAPAGKVAQRAAASSPCAPQAHARPSRRNLSRSISPAAIHPDEGTRVEAQIETAAGHRGTGTNQKHYRHLRPEYLSDFIEGVESFWADVGRYTDAHLRYRRDTKIVDLASARRSASKETQRNQIFGMVRLQDSHRGLKPAEKRWS